MGAIGLQMAARAAAAGWEVWGCDPDPARQQAARAAGIHVAWTPAESGRRADRLVVCAVRSLDQVEDALVGERGALRAARGRLGIVMSSVGAQAMPALGARAEACGGGLLDAPILGNPSGAAAGELTVVASGAEGDLAEARPLLEELAASVVWLGERLGAGQAMKIVSQLLQVVGMIATLEGVELAGRHGVPREAVLEVLRATAPSWTTANWAYASELWARRDPRTSLGLFAKDLAAAISDAAAVGLDLPLTGEARRLLDERVGGEGEPVRGEGERPRWTEPAP